MSKIGLTSLQKPVLPPAFTHARSLPPFGMLYVDHQLHYFPSSKISSEVIYNSSTLTSHTQKKTRCFWVSLKCPHSSLFSHCSLSISQLDYCSRPVTSFPACTLSCNPSSIHYLSELFCTWHLSNLSLLFLEIIETPCYLQNKPRSLKSFETFSPVTLPIILWLHVFFSSYGFSPCFSFSIPLSSLPRVFCCSSAAKRDQLILQGWTWPLLALKKYFLSLKKKLFGCTGS